MGLDMYLWAQRCFWSTEERPVIEGRPAKSVEFEAGYWRKANSVHGWIIRHCAGGVDNCQPIHMDRDRLKELLALCQELRALHKKNPKAATKLAMEKLPPTKGFFFGSQEIDEGYWQDVDDTVEILTGALSDFADEAKYDFIYQASW